MSEEKRNEGISLGVPLTQNKSSARPTSPTDSAQPVRSTSPAGATRSQLPPGQLPVELKCKVSAQMARLSVLQDMQERLPRIATLEHLLEFRGNVEDTFKMFLREHAYLETVWPAGCMEHPYFTENAFLQAHRAAGLLCFNCLGRHSAKSCRSSQKCKTCSGRHHTMLHVQPGSSKQGGSDKTQTSSSAH